MTDRRSISQKRRAITPKMKVDALLHRVWLQFRAYLKCPLSGEDMKAGDAIQFDHTHCVELDGPHVYGNLRPVLVDPHKRKTAADMRMIKKARPGHADKFVVHKPLTLSDAFALAGALELKCNPPKRKRKFPKGRKLQSRGFEKRKT